MSGVYSILETNVGVSMPAFPMFLTVLVPKCFISAQNVPKPKFSDDSVLNSRSWKATRRQRSTMNSSLLNTTIMKTVDMNTESRSRDVGEVNLVELQKSGVKTTTRSLQECSGL